MSKLMNKIDFVALIAVDRANANGDPLNGNRPRTDYNGFGEMSDVCIKRKLRNRMQDEGHNIFVQSDDRCDDGFGSLSERATAEMKGEKNRETYAQKTCAKWLDVRTFGQVFAFKDAKGVSVGVRGPVSIHQAVSISPIEVESLQITKSVNGEKGEKGGRKLTEKAGERGLFVALMLFVGIPLPGTGAWTGTLAASFLNMGIKNTTLAVVLGVILAGIIMGLASTGVFSVIGL